MNGKINMADYDDYGLDDDYSNMGGHKVQKIKKNKREKEGFSKKGHQSKQGESDFWTKMVENTDRHDESLADRRDETPFINKPNPAPRVTKPQPAISKIFTINKHEVDLTNVLAIQSVETVRGGEKRIYGIKFVFKQVSKDQKNYKIYWFDQAVAVRDHVYEIAIKKWKNFKEL